VILIANARQSSGEMVERFGQVLANREISPKIWRALRMYHCAFCQQRSYGFYRVRQALFGRFVHHALAPSLVVAARV
jgi:hypothetical protein